MQKPDAIIFDMDGTLWDAVDTYVWIWNEGFRQMGIERVFTREELLGQMGKQPDILIQESVEGCGDVDVEAVYHKIFDLQERSMLLLGGTLFDGVREGIEKLSQKYKLFLLSNCEKCGTGQFLEYTKLKDYFTDSINFGETRMPKALNLQLLKARHDLKNPVYVGDTASDGEQTRLSGMPFVFVSYGFGETSEFDIAFDQFEALTDYFMAL